MNEWHQDDASGKQGESFESTYDLKIMN